MEFKRSISTSGKFKNVRIVNGILIDDDTGEVIPLLEILEKIYCDSNFSISTSQKADSDVTPEDGDK